MTVLLLFEITCQSCNQDTVGGGRPFGGEQLRTTVVPVKTLWFLGSDRKVDLNAG